MLPQSQDVYSYSSIPGSSEAVPPAAMPLFGLSVWPESGPAAPSAPGSAVVPASAPHGPRSAAPSAVALAFPAEPLAPGVDRDVLFAEFQPLVRRLIRQYGGEDLELRQDLAGEIYYRFCSLLDAYDPGRGVPLRPYLVRQLTASVYTYARQQWRNRKREVSLEGRIEEGGEGAMSSANRGAHWTRAAAPVAYSRSAGCASLASLASAGSLSSSGALGGREWASDPTSAWDEAIVREELLRCLPHLISKLPQRQRQVLVWRYYEQRSFEEIAELLNVKVATTRSLLRHGLNTLRKGLRVGAALPE